MLAILFNAIRRILGMLLLLFSIYILIAIFGFSPQDHSLLHANALPAQNFAGRYGAYIADPALQAFGYAIILPIIFVITMGIKMAYNKKLNFSALKFSILCLTLPALSGLCSFISLSSEPILRNGGGFVGFYLQNEFTWSINKEAGFWICVSVSLIGTIISLHVSFSEWKTAMKFLMRSTYIGAISVIRGLRKLYSLNKIRLNASEDQKTIHINHSNLANHSSIAIEEDRDSKPHNLFFSKNESGIGIKNPQSKANKNTIKNLSLKKEGYNLPDSNLLDSIHSNHLKTQLTQEILDENAVKLKQVLKDFGVRGEVNKIFPGPIVTLYELEPSAGTKSSRVINLSDDIARSMSAISTRIAVIPGKNAIGIELPNPKRATVYLKELLENKEYWQNTGNLPLILGKNIGGDAVIADLAKMPHLLVAGTTGSGKSVAINTMILSLLYKHSPQTCKLVMIDPKMLELSVYDGIPHLITPVVTDPKKAVCALKWVVREMEERYRAMSLFGVRNIQGYNKVVQEYLENGKVLAKKIQTGFDQELGNPIFETIEMKNETLPYIVVIVDEMADLMLVAGKDIEAYIQRLAQMARAAGIHIIMATQRPSVDVITGVIKANFPTRISFQVTSKIDSRTILGEQGAEQLLGMGDMLYMMPGGRIERVHGPFVQDKEVENIVAFLKTQGTPNYISEEVFYNSDENIDTENNGEVADELYDKAVNIVLQDRKASTSYLQRCLKIGYNRAASLMERMEKEGIVSLPNHVGKRDILK